MKKIITITTDLKDEFATSQIHAVLARRNFNGKVIENHDVKPYSIVEGAYGIWQLIKNLPIDSINVGIVDPGVGSRRFGIIIKTKKFWFVGPNNGLFWPASTLDQIQKVWRIDESYFGKVSNTFHGRDVFIKVAVLLSKNLSPEKFGCNQITKKVLTKLEFKNGQIVHIDDYGTLKVWGNNTFELPVVNTFSDISIGKAGILKGSSDLLEVFVNQSSAKDYFKVKLGQVIKKL